MRDAGEVDGHNLRRSIGGKRSERTVDQRIVSLSEWAHLRGGLQLPGRKLEADFLLRRRIGGLDEESLGECVLRRVLLLLNLSQTERLEKRRRGETPEHG